MNIVKRCEVCRAIVVVRHFLINILCLVEYDNIMFKLLFSYSSNEAKRDTSHSNIRNLIETYIIAITPIILVLS